eukprot:scaffold28762_cov38-Tisochrysis_lutea.AAC.1
METCKSNPHRGDCVENSHKQTNKEQGESGGRSRLDSCSCGPLPLLKSSTVHTAHHASQPRHPLLSLKPKRRTDKPSLLSHSASPEGNWSLRGEGEGTKDEGASRLPMAQVTTSAVRRAAFSSSSHRGPR